MAIFPRIQSPCPYKGDLSAIMDGEVCRLCKREVFDLTHMSDGERVDFMEGCTGKVCVQYRFAARPAVAAALVAAAIAAPTAAAACDATEVMVIMGGGINDPAHAEYYDPSADAAIPPLPVVYEPANTDDASSSTPPQQHAS